MNMHKFIFHSRKTRFARSRWKIKNATEPQMPCMLDGSFDAERKPLTYRRRSLFYALLFHLSDEQNRSRITRITRTCSHGVHFAYGSFQ